MKCKFFKVAALCCTCMMVLGNTMAVYAEEKPMVISEPNVTSSEMEKLIEVVLDIKEANPGKSEQEIFEIVSKSLENERKETRGISDIWNALTEAEKKLLIRYPLDALKVNDAKNIATRQTERKFGHNGLGDRSDAFRHGIWNAEMTILIGAEKAELFATAHEEKDTTGVEPDGHTKVEHKNMDLHNNNVGREIGLAHPDLSEEQMADYIYDVIYQENTPFVWLND